MGVGVLGATQADAVPSPIQYTCSDSAFGDLTSEGHDPFLVTLTGSFTHTVAPGDTFPAVTVDATVQASKYASGIVGTQTIMPGFSLTDYTVGPYPQQLRLDYGKTTNTSGGALVLSASGKTSSFTVPDAPGTYPITIGGFTDTLTLESGFVAHLTCKPLAGQPNLVVGTLTIAAPSTSTSTSAPASSSSSAPAPTSSAPASTSSAPTTTGGPTPSQVQTGSAASTDGPNLGVLGGGLTALGAITLGGAAALRRRDRH